MTSEEFQKWFLEHLDQMASMNIYHWNTDRAKDIKAILEILYPEIDNLYSRIEKLEKLLINKTGEKCE